MSGFNKENFIRIEQFQYDIKLYINNTHVLFCCIYYTHNVHFEIQKINLWWLIHLDLEIMTKIKIVFICSVYNIVPDN